MCDYLTSSSYCPVPEQSWLPVGSAALVTVYLLTLFNVVITTASTISTGQKYPKYLVVLVVAISLLLTNQLVLSNPLLRGTNPLVRFLRVLTSYAPIGAAVYSCWHYIVCKINETASFWIQAIILNLVLIATPITAATPADYTKYWAGFHSAAVILVALSITIQYCRRHYDNVLILVVMWVGAAAITTTLITASCFNLSELWVWCLWYYPQHAIAVVAINALAYRRNTNNYDLVLQ